jgi:hypothetical protein
MDAERMDELEDCEAALQAFVAIYRVMYNVDQIYSTSYEDQQELERKLRAVYDQAISALGSRSG